MAQSGGSDGVGSIMGKGPETLRIGVFLPTWEPGTGMDDWTIAGYPDGWRWPDVLASARAAEDAGLDSVWVCDHMLMDDDWVRPGDGLLKEAADGCGTWDAWAILAAIAATTSRIELGSLVGCTAYQNPARMAKLADTIDEVSAGRLILGIGAGDHWSEFQRFGIPVERPVARFEEALQIIGPLLREGHVDFEGEFYAARDCALSPRGRAGGPPILIGALGSGRRMARLVAQHADLWNGWYVFDDEPDLAPSLREQLALVDTACVAQGREPGSLGRTAGISVAFGDAEASPATVRGSYDEIAARLVAIRDAGVSHVQVVLSPPGPAAIEELARVAAIVRAA